MEKNDSINRQSVIDLVHKTIYGFFDIADDESEEPMNEKDKLLLELNKALCNRIEGLPPAQPELYCAPQSDLSDDGTLMITVPHGMLDNVKRVLIDEVGTKFCKLVYTEQHDCSDCIKNGGDWDCDHINCHKQQANESAWIPVSEKLPEKNDWYLTTIDGEICGSEEPIVGMSEFKNGRWSSGDDVDESDMTIAWQPLPESYLGGENEI